MKTLANSFPGSVFILLLAVFLGSACPGWSAVTFSVTPTTVSNTYGGTISLQVGGLTNGESVLIQKFLDLNTNGAIDNTDLLIQQFKLTDGTNFVIGGVTNFNVPGDLNTATGAITSVLNFQNGDFSQNIIGKYLYKLSSPSNRFTAITNLFSVTNSAYLQKITGNVVSNGTTTVVADAIVLLFPPPQSGSHGPGTPVAGAVANNSGIYTIEAPAGSYVPLAIRNNYVANYSAAPLVTLADNSTITTNLALTNATASISGQVVDAANTAKGLPGVFMPVDAPINGQEYITVGFSDTNGYFTNRVISGKWSLGSDDTGLIILGYVGYQGSTNVNSGATGVILAYPKATALFYGRVTDGSGNPLMNLDMGSYDSNDGLYQADGYTDANGDYVVGVVGGLGGSDPWWVGFDGNSSAYIFSQPDFDQNGGTNISAGQAVLANFTALPATNDISGNVQFNGANVVGVGVSASATINGVNYNLNSVDTDANGNYTLPVANGVWSVNVICQGGNDSLDNLLGSGNYECPDNQNITINNDNGTANFTVQSCSGVQIYTTSLPSGQVGTYYDTQLQGSTCTGNVNWSLVNPQNFPGGFTFNSDGEFFGNPANSGTYNFTVQLSDGNGNSATQALSLTISAVASSLQVTNASLPNGTIGAAYSVQLGATGGVGSYSWSLENGSANPPPGLTLYSSGVISGTPTASLVANFLVQVNDQNSGVAYKALSITINPKPVLGEINWRTNQFEMLLTGGSNQNYTVQTATNLISPNWISLFTTNNATANSFLIVDPHATNATRFYRILIGP